MFEHNYKPSGNFSADEIQHIADVSINIWEDDPDIYEFLNNLGDPLWIIYGSDYEIHLELHSNLTFDEKYKIIRLFKETVDAAVAYVVKENAL